jgi:SagB-type dehydrogenase family enzyme
VGSRRGPGIRYRRSSHLVCHWDKGQFILHNYATSIRAPATSLAVEILDLCKDWRPASALAADMRTLDSTVLDTVLSALVEHTFLERSDRPLPASSDLYAQWDGWRPAAAFFHATTKDVRYADPSSVDARLRRKATADPPPSPLKQTLRAGKAVVLSAPMIAPISAPPVSAAPLSARMSAVSPALPTASVASGALHRVLQERRTWRQFGSAAVSSDHLATLLGLTWGVQQWMHVDGFNRMALKTSPSGGARHSIEAYAYVRRVTGVRRGWYHYDPDRHALQPLAAVSRAGAGAGTRARKISDYLPTQGWYDDAAVLIVMTAVFARAQWRYGYARAYRSILAEAGHLAQTFCLVATALDLAPFCSMALADSAIERDLRVDGVSESVVYATGVGQRPDGVEWAPWPNTSAVPRIEAPTWKRRSRRLKH